MDKLATLLPMALTGLLPCQSHIAFLEGPNANVLQLRVVSESAPSAQGRVVLSGLRVLPIELTNRLSQHDLRTDVPRLVAANGVSRIELPQHGRLLRYSRASGTEFGFFQVHENGDARIVFELPGVGPAGTGDPLEEFIGAGIDGRHAAFTTATGKIFVGLLDGAHYPSTGSATRLLATPSTVDPGSVCVSRTHIFFQTEDDRVWRCSLADRSIPEDVTPVMGPSSIMKDEMAMSGDGKSVVFLYGPREQQKIWMLRRTGPAVALPPPPSKYEEPGYLPETPLGPRMMLNQDGSRLLYTDASNRDEIFLLDTTGSQPTTHLTSDANMQPYIGVSILPSFVGTTLWIAIGDIAKFDWFSATTESTATTNVTRTANEAVAPFGAGNLLPLAGFRVGGKVLAQENDGAGGTRLRQVSSGGTILAGGLIESLRLGSVTALTEALPQAGEYPVAGLPSKPTILMRTVAGDVTLTTQLQAVLTTPLGIRLSTEQRGMDGVSAFCAWMGGTGVPILRLPSGSLLALPPDNQLTQTVRTRSGVAVNGTNLNYYAGPTIYTLSSQPYRIVIS